MLSDPRALAFAENFAGQWLETRNLDVVRPDPDILEDWDAELRESMKRETAMFFQHVMSQRVVKVLPEESLVLIRGGIPGSRNGLVVVRGATRKSAQKSS
jgi:ribosomal protein L3